MTNAEIIMRESFELVKQGRLALIGEGEDAMPEPIHTFQKWKELGFQVKKGEKSDIKFPIWKHSKKSVKDEGTGEEKERTSMFMKTAAFFTFAQVEKI